MDKFDQYFLHWFVRPPTFLPVSALAVGSLAVCAL